jgi:RHS repeat-associated protein
MKPTTAKQEVRRNMEVRRLICLVALITLAPLWSFAAHAQANCESAGANLSSDCATEALAYARATEDARKYFADNPKNAYGDKNKLCPTIKTRYNGPYVWVASVPTLNFPCTEEGGGYINPVFRAHLPQSTATPPDAGSSPFDPGKNNQCSVATGPNMVGNPVNLVTGYKTQSATDFVDPAGHLDFNRYYTSAQTAYNPTGTLGFGWRHSFQSAVMAYTGKDPRLVRPSGDSYAFTRVGERGVFDADVPEQVAVLTAAGQITGWQVTTTDDKREYFNARGRLERVEFTDGDILTLTYNADNQLLQVVDRRSRALTFTHANGSIASVTFPDGTSVTYTQQNNLLTAVEHRSAQGVSSGSIGYRYEDTRNRELLTGIVDENGDRYAAWSYDQYGRAVTSRHGGVDSPIDLVTLSYQTGSTTVTGALGDSVAYGHKFQLGRGKVTSTDKACATCGGRSAQSTVFDQSGYPSQRTDFSGTTAEVQYNARGLVIRGVDAANDAAGNRRTVHTDWHPEFRVPTERRTYSASNVLVAKTTWAYNGRGQATATTQVDPTSGQARTDTTVYCEAADVVGGSCPMVGLVKQRIAPGNLPPTSYVYYAADDAGCAVAGTTCAHRKGDLWKVINPAGHTVEHLAYDGAGRVTSQKDSNGQITSFEYHPRGWLSAIRVHGAGGAPDRVTRTEYWPTGLTKRVIQPDGSFVSYGYDAAHRLVEVADNAGNKIQYVLDNAGNRVAENTRDAAGALTRTLSRIYNSRGELTTQADAADNPTDFAYDNNGNRASVTDALGRVNDYAYDPLNRVERSRQDVGGIGAESRFKYDELDNLTEVTDPKGLKTTYGRDAFGQVLTQASPDTGVTTFTYDSAGNALTRTDARGVTAQYEYDALNRTTAVRYADPAADISYVYDQLSAQCPVGERAGVGRLSSMIDSSGRTDYCYSAMGDLVRRVQVVEGQALTLRYAYDASGRPQSMTYPDGSLVDYGYDAQGEVNVVGVTPVGGTRKVLLQGAKMLPFGPEQSWTFGNGRRLDRSYDLDYRPKTISDERDGLNVALGFDPVGNITSLTDGGPQGQGATLDYDALGRLTAFKDAQTGVAIEQYTYDATGNRLSFGNSAGVQAYVYPAGSHRLMSVDGVDRTYDAMGNTLTIGGDWQYAYDLAGRLGSATRAGSAQASYRHNAAGQRVLQQVGTDKTLHLHGEGGEWLGSYSPNGAPTQQVVWLGSRPVGLIQAGKVLYIESDHLGSPRALIDPQRDVAVWRWSLLGEAFGNGSPAEDPDQDGVAQTFDLRFPGQRAERSSGLTYNYFRDYDPRVGRYAESDPIGLDGGMSTYLYVGASPVMFKDPTGLIKHITGEEIDCGKGCWIRIDKVHNEKTGETSRHLHWGCRNKESVCGENGLPSHKGSWDDVPSFVKECALRNGFLGRSAPEPRPREKQDMEMSPGAKATLYGAAALWMLGTLIWGW